MSAVASRLGTRSAPVRVAAVTLAFLLVGVASTAASAADTPSAAACAEPVPEVFERVAPAVVYVAATSINPYRLSDRVTRTIGSGFIIDRTGLVVTNAHVAFRRQSIRVVLDSGENLPAELVGVDPLFDLAVLRITPPPDVKLPVLELGDSDRIRVGDDVLAIGNPLGLDQTLTRGIVSALNRILPDAPFSLENPLIQTDAAINPGSSGGPLLNRCGEVIGINTAMIADAQGIGFAIPVNLAKAVLPSLIEKSRVVRPWVGFHGQVVGDALRDLLRIPLVEGLLVEVVEPGSPAKAAGIHGGQLEIVVAGEEFLVGGDVVTSVNGVRIGSPERLVEAMRGLAVGSTLRLSVFRNGDYRDVEYVLPERPTLPGDVPSLRSARLANRRLLPSAPLRGAAPTR